MKVTATTVSYDGTARVVMLEFSGPGCDPTRYVMKPDDWETIQPVYLARPDVILELIYRDATSDEVEQVLEVEKKIRNIAREGIDLDGHNGTESSVE